MLKLKFLFKMLQIANGEYNRAKERDAHYLECHLHFDSIKETKQHRSKLCSYRHLRVDLCETEEEYYYYDTHG